MKISCKFHVTLFILVFISLGCYNDYAQIKIIFTSIDYNTEDVRAVICDFDGSNRIDLGFNKTYLPVWFNDKILFNSDTYMWECDTAGNNLKQLPEGFRISVSNDKTKFAFYNSKGIAISDSSGKIIKQILVDAWEDITITWSKDDEMISFYNPELDICYLFKLSNDSLMVFGDSIYHPLWNKKNDKILYNKITDEGFFDVMLIDSLGSKNPVRINSEKELAVVPVWSNSGEKIAYLSAAAEPEEEWITDMLTSKLILYDLNTSASIILTERAGFTDQAFPQIFFDENDEYIYFTSINDNGMGALTRINLNFLNNSDLSGQLPIQIEIISKDSSVDDRFPQVKKF
jgi:hypothetical protein